MSTHTGYLLIADISGYTAYLTQSEMDHANPILQSLLEALVTQIGEPMHLWRTEGDAVLAYSTEQEFPSGDTFLAICENLYQAMGIRTEMLEYVTHFEHFGDVPMRVYDLAEAWEEHRANAAVVRVEDKVVYSFRHSLPVPPAVAWELLTAPELKRRWMDMRAVGKESDGRIGPGTRFHCIHEQATFRYRITDWRPFDYFSTWFQDPFNPHLGHAETYDLIPTDNGVELFYRMGPLVDDEANHHPEEEARLIEVYQGFWPDALSGLDEMISQNA